MIIVNTPRSPFYMILLFAIDITFNRIAFIIRITSNLIATRNILIYSKLHAILIKIIII
jgi:hypothetical protein